MCVLAVGVRLADSLPIVLAANRDEYYDRPSEPPRLLAANPGVFGGFDPRGGGTWLGINEHGVVVALTNRYVAIPERAGLPSRGGLCLQALCAASAREAVARVAGMVAGADYNGFSLVALDRVHAWRISNPAEHGPAELTPGWHVVANAGFDDPDDPRVARARQLLADIAPTPGDRLPEALFHLCRDHGDPRSSEPVMDALCVHRPQAGTRSASVVLVEASGKAAFWHAEGAPCQAELRRLTLPWVQK
jgi:uncharacterized protein with NRDE domain